MIKKKLILPAMLSLGIVFAGCNKYEEGPAISLIPKKERVANTWVVEQAMEDGNDVTSEYDQYEVYLAKDGDAQLDANYTAFGIQYTVSSDGTWMFTNDEENIEMDYEDDSQDKEYQILKLTDDEFWLREVGQDVELRLKEK